MTITQEKLNEIANRYCEYVINWGFQHRPERMPALFTGATYFHEPEKMANGEMTPGFTAGVSADDVCDGNMAMDEAMRDLGYGETLDRWLDEENDARREQIMEQEVCPIWNPAYTIAEKNRWMPVAGKTGQIYLICWPSGYGDAHPRVVDLDYFTPDLGFKEGDIEAIDTSHFTDIVDLSGPADRCYVVNLGDDGDRSKTKEASNAR
jgi:hypothetical protein